MTTLHTIDPAPSDLATHEGPNRCGRMLKRATDATLAFFLILLFSPLFLAIFLAIRVEDGAPAFFKQERIGRYGKPFFILKFRSMHHGSEPSAPSLCAGEDVTRLTHVGRFLRDHHLDELPQLWNVLVGDMSFIGPRPERKYFIDQIIKRDPRYTELYKIRPGVTSYATLYNGYTDTMEKMLRRLELDLYYLKHYSWTFDLKILWQTFIRIVRGDKF